MPPTDTAGEGRALAEARETVHAWIRDDAPLSVKMGLMPEHVTALVSKLAALRAAADPVGRGSGEGQQGRDPGGSGPSPFGQSPAVSAPAGVSVPRAPAAPSPGLLMSMALRYDHGFAVPGYYDRDPPGIGKPGSDRYGHARRLANTMSSMRQLWEEATGNGFYEPHREEKYVTMAATLGVTFTESGFPIAARVSGEHPTGEDAQRAAEGEACRRDGEAGTPDLSSDPPPHPETCAGGGEP